MTRLSDLPNEVLRQISSHVMPEDIENFAQTSKHLQAVSGTVVEEHRRLIRKYHQLSGTAALKTVVPLLLEVLACPHIGRYVKQIYLYGEPDDDDDEYAREFWQENEVEKGGVNDRVPRPGKEQNRARIHAAIDESKIFYPQHLDSIHVDVKDDIDFLLAIVLPLLPDLTFLSIAKSRVCRISAVITWAKELNCPILSSLKHVHMEHIEDPLEVFGFDDLEGFLLLPSLQILSSAGVRQDEWTREILEAPRTISNVTQLEFCGCHINPAVLDHYLSHFPHLQSFVYEHYENDDESHAYIVRAALQARVSATLRKLHLRNSAASTYMGPLCDFKVLEDVDSEWEFLFPHMELEFFDHDREVLSSILPASIRVVSISDWKGRVGLGEHRGLISHAVQAKTGPNAPLPLLESLELLTRADDASWATKELRDGGDCSLQRQCDEVGLSLYVSPLI